MDRTRILRSVLKFKFKGKRHVRQPRRRTSRREGIDGGRLMGMIVGK
jgi:hypothetical protein